MANIRYALGLVLCILWSVDCLHLDRIQHSRSKLAISRSQFRLYSRPEDEIKVAGDRENISKDLAKYETRSKLLEAALLTQQKRQAASDTANKDLLQRLSELQLKNDAVESKCRQVAAEKDEAEAQMQEVALKASKALQQAAFQAEKTLQLEKTVLTADVLKYKNRLALLESAYRESQDKTTQLEGNYVREISSLKVMIMKLDEEKKEDRVHQETFLESTRSKMNILKTSIEEKIEEISILKNLLVEEKKIVLDLQAELKQSEALAHRRKREESEEKEKYVREEEMKRDNLEKEMIQRNLLERKIEIEKREKDEIEKNKNKKIQNEVTTNNNPGTGTFSDFLNKNKIEEKRIELAYEEQAVFLQQQRNILFETDKLLKSASDEKIDILTQSLVLSGNIEEQKRVLERQTAMLETLVEKISCLNQNISLQLKDSTRKNDLNSFVFQGRKINYDINDENNMKIGIENNINIDDNVGVDNDTESNEFYDRKQNQKDAGIPKNFPRIVPENKMKNIPDDFKELEFEIEFEDGSVDLGSVTSQAKAKVSDFISKIITKISGNDDNVNNEENKNIEKNGEIVSKSAQEQRIKIARKSGRILRNFGGVLVKTATDTLGFWVGLGFDDDDNEDNGNDEDNEGNGDDNRNKIGGRNDRGGRNERGGRDGRNGDNDERSGGGYQNELDDDGYDQAYNKEDDYNNRNYENKRNNVYFDTDPVLTVVSPKSLPSDIDNKEIPNFPNFSDFNELSVQNAPDTVLINVVNPSSEIKFNESNPPVGENTRNIEDVEEYDNRDEDKWE